MEASQVHQQIKQQFEGVNTLNIFECNKFEYSLFFDGKYVCYYQFTQDEPKILRYLIFRNKRTNMPFTEIAMSQLTQSDVQTLIESIRDVIWPKPKSLLDELLNELDMFRDIGIPSSYLHDDPVKFLEYIRDYIERLQDSVS